MDLTYLASERFIHLDLMERAAAIANEVRDVWKQTQHVDSYAITWPGETVHGDSGETINGAVMCALDETLTESQRLETLHKMVKRTKAYGLVLVENQKTALRVLFETAHGARAWLMPLERHGDTCILGVTQVKDDADCVGLLWRPTAH